MYIKVVVLCSNSNGEPEFFTCSPEVVHQELIEGVHYDLAKECASDNGFKGPMIAFDENDTAAKQFGSLLTWI